MNVALLIIFVFLALAIFLGIRAQRGKDMNLEQWTVGEEVSERFLSFCSSPVGSTQPLPSWARAAGRMGGEGQHSISSPTAPSRMPSPPGSWPPSGAEPSRIACTPSPTSS